jgi:hypothetical protein
MNGYKIAYLMVATFNENSTEIYQFIDVRLVEAIVQSSEYCEVDPTDRTALTSSTVATPGPRSDYAIKKIISVSSVVKIKMYF